VENYIILSIILVHEAKGLGHFSFLSLKSLLSYLTSKCYVTVVLHIFNILPNKKSQAVCPYCAISCS